MSDEHRRMKEDHERMRNREDRLHTDMIKFQDRASEATKLEKQTNTVLNNRTKVLKTVV